jgi:hypothetical protein
LSVFENRVLGRIFGPKRDEVTGGWRKLHNDELHGLYSSASIVRVIKAKRMRWAGHVARMGEVRGAYNILIGRPEGRRPLGRPRRRLEDNIKMNLWEIGFVGCGLGSGWGQVAGSCEHGNEPSDSTKCGEFLDQLSVPLAS